MSSKKEVEIKFRITNSRELTAHLRASGFRRVTPRTHEMNTLYDLPDRQLRKRGELLRLRKYGSDWLLTHKAKGPPGRHKTRVETQTTVENGGKMEGILRALRFQPAFRYEKFRSEWSDSKGHVVLDHTPVGDFGEIEGPPRWIDRVAKKLGIERKDYITKTYAELFEDWKSQTRSQGNEMTFEAVGRAATKPNLASGKRRG